MKLDCIMTACNTNYLYIDFIPIFVKAWNKLYPNIDVKIVLISNKIPIEFEEYKDNIILFTPIPNISIAFIAQYIRLLYPTILNYQNGIMITDIDMIPMNSMYYIKNIENISDNKFIYLRNVLLNYKQIAMCYNIGLNKIWSEIFNIKSIEDINKRLIDVYNNIQYVDEHGKFGWSTDQIYTMNWNKTTNNFISLPDDKTGFRRLNRNKFEMSNKYKNLIKQGYYTYYHCYRPYTTYKSINDSIIELL